MLTDRSTQSSAYDIKHPDIAESTSYNQIGRLEKGLNYTFKKKELLIEALTHRSYFHEKPDKSHKYNERFEFLGDAVLGLSITEILFRENTSFSEAEMSKLKAYLVSREMLSQIAADLEIGSYIRLGKGEELTGGRKKTSIAANTLEAIIGAIFLDSDYQNVRSVITQLYAPTIDRVLNEDSPYDYKTTLQEISQTLFATLPEYRLVSETGDDHNKTFTYDVYLNGKPLGEGSGKSKKTAQMKAARKALDNLNKKN
ncbi:MAG: ribonuclease III [Nitrospirae bacterium]|nr:ribonuclease III [Nitrospirota bacterium]